MSDIIDGTSVTIQEILDFLPHRYPFLLVDRVEEMEGEERAISLKTARPASHGLPVHFPERPVFPACLSLRPLPKSRPYW